VEVFELKELKKFRTRIEKSSKLRKRLEKDFEGTLKAEGIIVNEAFRKEVDKQCKARIKARIKTRMDTLPKSKKVYYNMISAGEPIKVRVKIDRKREKTTIIPRGGKK
jgi:hypothetical protein